MKRSVKFIVVSVMLILTLSFLGCGTTKESKNDQTTEATTATIASNGKYTSLENYLKDDTVNTQLQKALDTTKNDDMDIAVTAEGAKLVYAYTFKTIELTSEMTDKLNTAIDQQSSTFSNLASQLSSYVDISNPSIVVRYYDSKNQLITEREFTAQ